MPSIGICASGWLDLTRLQTTSDERAPLRDHHRSHGCILMDFAYVPRVTLPTLEQVRTIAVIGAGTMGHGIAHVARRDGRRGPPLRRARRRGARAASTRSRKNLAKGVELGKVTAADRDAALARLSALDDLAAACAGADCVIEAVPERIELKREIFAAIDRRRARARAARDEHVVAADRARSPRPSRDGSRLVGMHFFNPVHVMKLVEVVRHARLERRGGRARGRARREAWARRRSRSTDSPGFASSRLGLVIGLEAMRMVEQGVASAADIDTAMKLGYGHPMGPLELTDLVGLDVRLGIAEYLTSAIGPSVHAAAGAARQGRRRQARQEDRRGLLSLVAPTASSV